MRAVLVFAVLVMAAACRRAGQGALDRLHPCAIEEGPPDAYCGTYRVFEDRAAASGRYDRPQDRRCSRAAARSPDPTRCSSSKADPAAAPPRSRRTGSRCSAGYQTDRDIVLVDQRGTGASNPLDCTDDDPDADDLGSIDSYPVERFRACLEKLQADAAALHDVDRDGRHRRRPALSRIRVDQLVGRLLRDARRAGLPETA